MLKKILAVLSVIFILSSLALPAFAIYPPEQLSLTGWRFDSHLEDLPWTGSLKAFLGLDSVTSLGISLGGSTTSLFSDMLWSDGELTYVNEQGFELIVYTDGLGWAQDNYRTVGFSYAFPDPINADDPTYRFALWLYQNAVQTLADGVDVPVVSWVIDNDIFSFSNFVPAANRQMTPSVTVNITQEGLVQLFVSGRFKTWRPASGRVFTGLSFEDDNIPEITPGTSQVLVRSDVTSTSYPLYPCYEDESSDSFTTTIRIYNSDGSRLLFDYTALGLISAPLLTVKPREGVIYFDEGSDPLAEYSVSNDYPNLNFAGLAVRRMASVPSYGLDSDITVGGTAQSGTYVFYLVFDTPINDPVGVDWTSWIATAVGGFFSFELWPDLSLGDLLLTVVCIGVFFAFLKMTL